MATEEELTRIGQRAAAATRAYKALTDGAGKESGERLARLWDDWQTAHNAWREAVNAVHRPPSPAIPLAEWAPVWSEGKKA